MLTSSLPLDGFYHAIQAGNFGPFKPQVVRKCDKMFVSSFLYEAFQFFMILIRFLRLSFILIIALAFITREREKVERKKILETIYLRKKLFYA